MSGEPEQGWKRCSSCKKPIAFGAMWWACNVSTCNRPRTALVFCTVSCWDSHLSIVNHRESWAVERRAPSRAEAAQSETGVTSSATAPQARGSQSSQTRGSQSSQTRGSQSSQAMASHSPRRILPPPTPKPKDPIANEVLIVASRLKAYVLARSGFSTSDRTLYPLSDAVRELCDRAIEKARAEGRRTVLERDFD